MRRRWIIFAAAILAAPLAGCGESPKPFESGNAIPPASIEEASEFEGISVNLLQGAPEHVAAPLAETLSQVLQGMGTPASAAQQFRGHFLLQGRVGDPGPPTAARPRPIADVTWRLIGPSGDGVMEFLQRINGPSDGWRVGDPVMLQRIALDAAAPIADAYRAAVESGAAAAKVNRDSVALVSLNGLDGNRRAIMVRSFRQAVTLRGLKSVADAGEANFSVAGAFEIGPPLRGRRTVAVTWTVNDDKGRELGKVSQENFLPEPLSDSLWRQISAAIAAGAGDGIADLVKQAGG